MTDDPVAVIGGGLGGLAAAVVLAARGHRVTLLEANDWLGGKAAVLDEDGYRFDMGPTILTLPRVLARIVGETGGSLDGDLPMTRLDPQWRCFFEDGAVLDLLEDTEAMCGGLDRFAPGAAAGYRRFLQASERLHDISERFFFWKSVEDVRDTIDVRANLSVSTLSDLLALRMGATVAGTIRGHVSETRVAQMLDHLTQYVGSSPFNAPAVLCSIAHMQTSEGIWYPDGGTRAIPAALERLARSLGVEIRTGTPVSRIVVENGRAVAVETGAGVRLKVSAVVSNMDAVRTYRQLVGGAPGERFEKRRSYEPACSGVVLYLGLDRAYDHLAHHDFVFSRDAEEEFDWIYRRGEPAPDPTCYICAPARTDPTVAPDGAPCCRIIGA